MKKYTLTLCSMFRDSNVWCGAKINQVQRFKNSIINDPLFNRTKVILLEGNSQDDTYNSLIEFSDEYYNVEVIKEDIDGAFDGSIVNSKRMSKLGNLGDKLLERVDTDYLVWVESDLIWDTPLLATLLESIKKTEFSVVSPLVFLQNKQIFYDTWGFRNIDGTHWTNHYPFSPFLEKYDRFVPMNSIGSCAIVNGDYIKRGCRFGNNAFVGLCDSIRNLGGTIVVDTNFFIYHPSNAFINKRWI